MRLITFTEFSERLAGDSNGAVKALLLHDSDGEVLELKNCEELAQLCAALTVRTFPPAKRAIQQRILKAMPEGAAPGGSAWVAHFVEHESDFPFDRYQRKASGEVKLEPGTNLPLMTSDDNKMGTLLRNPYAALAVLDLRTPETTNALNDFLASRSTHPAKLSYERASGSFVLAKPRVPYVSSVTEADFLTVQTETFAVKNAALQPAMLLFISRVSFKGTVVRLHELYRCPELMEKVWACWSQNDVPQGTKAFLQELGGYRAQPVRGEPQVFVGPVPDHLCLSVMTPFALFKEVVRAKEALSAQLEAENEEVRAALEKKKVALTTELESAKAKRKALTKPSRVQREGFKEEQATIKSELERVSKALKVTPEEPSFRSFELLYGGSTPRNLAAELDKSLHTANVLLFVPVSRQHRVDKAEMRSHRAASLLQGRAYLPPKLPSCLNPGALDAPARQQRTKLFAELMAQRAAPLLELKFYWLTRSDELTGEAALSEKAATLGHLSPELQAFIAGAPSLEAPQRAELRRQLADTLTASASAALHSAYSDEYSANHFDELRACALRFVQAEGTY